jgi:3-oxoacyl-[acyl-carrier-protein] synthase-3
MLELAHDPFQGARERRELAPDQTAADMEVAAATEAIERANLKPEDVDLLITFAICPDYQGTNNACAVHKRLGLRQDCLALFVDAACNSFMQQLLIAEQFVRTGRVRNALLVQSCSLSRLAPVEAHYAPWFGDGATAVIVGPARPERGLLARADRADGTRLRAVLHGVAEKRWYDEGRVIIYSEDPRGAREMLLTLADRGQEVVAEALRAAGHRHDEVKFYACHQATSWFRRITQEQIGLSNARFVDTFPWSGSLSAANVPLQLAIAEREGLLKDGDLTVLYAGGTGETWAAAVLVWGE